MSEYTIRATPQCHRWLASLRDSTAKGAILRRIDQAADGHWGDCKPIGGGLSEMRVFVGPGYRIYFCRIGTVLIMLLNGSDKTDQNRAIRAAKQIMIDLKENQHG